MTEDTMREVKFWEHSSTNSGEYLIAHMVCGHTRTFERNSPPRPGWHVRCWECDKLAAMRRDEQRRIDDLDRVSGVQDYESE